MWQPLLLFYPEIDLTFAGRDKSYIHSQKKHLNRFVPCCMDTQRLVLNTCNMYIGRDKLKEQNVLAEHRHKHHVYIGKENVLPAWSQHLLNTAEQSCCLFHLCYLILGGWVKTLCGKKTLQLKKKKTLNKDNKFTPPLILLNLCVSKFLPKNKGM